MCRGDLSPSPPLVTRLITSWFTASVEKAWLDEILFFEVVILMVKNKKICTIKDTMPIKINLVHYRNLITWTRAKLPVAFVKNNFESIRFYSIEKKSLFLYIFSSSSLSLSRLLRYYIIFFTRTNKKPLTFCFLLKFLSWCPCQHRITDYQSFHFSLFLP